MSSLHWWQHAVVYQVYVRSFADSNGDGIGDLEGVRQHLPELEALGVDAIWLNPCYPSPQKDHGYDITDYFGIEPTYGDLGTFDRLVGDAASRGIKVLMDIVPNHCSADHQWFQEALAAAPGSPERERFYFMDGKGPDHSEPPNNWHALFGGSAWTRVDSQWYLHTFTPWQPDFNWDSPAVRQHFFDAMRFWFDRGVEGFRVDAVVPVGKAPGLPDAPPVPADLRETDITLHNPYTTMRPEGHEVWRAWRSFVDAYADEHPDRDPVLVAEAYTPQRPDLLAQYTAPDEFHQAFAFDLLLAPWDAGFVRRAIDDGVSSIRTHGVAPTWALNNHDAQRIVTRLGRADAADVSSYTGNNLISSDAPVDLAVGTRRARAMVALMLGLPGAAYLYMGEELGLPEVLDIPPEARQDPIFLRTKGVEIGRDGCRVPIPWTATPDGSFGFSPPTTTIAPWLPQPSDWGRYGADAQSRDPDSMLGFYRRLLAARRTAFDPQAPAGTTLDIEMLESDGYGDVVAFRRGDVLVVMNLGSDPAKVSAASGMQFLLASNWAAEGDVTAEAVPGETTVWFTR